MEWLRSWLLSMTCAALIATLADALCPDGVAKKLTRMAGGLLLLLAALGPVAKLDEGSLAGALNSFRLEQSAALPATAEGEEVVKSIIAQETAAYISDKAAALGLEEVQVKVTCRMTEDGFPAPDTVELRGKGSEAAWDRLERALLDDFALPSDAQTLERMDVK